MPPSIAPTSLWTVFTIFILGMLALDLWLHRKPEQLHHKRAFIWVTVWITLAIVFYIGMHLHFGRQRGLEFLTGYLIEYSLSVDNLFVFLVIFRYFSVPARYQHRVLFWGILGALIMRFVFIVVGTALLHRFEWIIYVFGAIVILGGIKMLKQQDVAVHPETNLVLRVFKKFVRTTTEEVGDRFLVRRNGQVYATPLLLVLVMVEATDVAFAADSIPAIFAITRDPFIVFSSNVFAILGLRSLYLLIATAIDRFHYLNWGLGLVLLFVGVKMLIGEHYHIPTGYSLAVIGTLLGTSVAISLLRPPKPRPAVPAGPPPVPVGPKRERPAGRRAQRARRAQ